MKTLQNFSNSSLAQVKDGNGNYNSEGDSHEHREQHTHHAQHVCVPFEKEHSKFFAKLNNFKTNEYQYYFSYLTNLGTVSVKNYFFN